MAMTDKQAAARDWLNRNSGMKTYKCTKCGKPCALPNFTLLMVSKSKYIGYCKECERKRGEAENGND